MIFRQILTTALFSCLAFVGVLLARPIQVSAQSVCKPDGEYICRNGCSNAGDCRGGRLCEAREYGGVKYLANIGDTCGTGQGRAIIGGIRVPQAILRLNAEGTSSAIESGIGALAWFNRILILFFSICVVWFMVQLVMHGAKVVSNPGEAKALEELKEAITFPVIGMILLAASFLIASLVGIFFFGDADFITNPTLPTAQDFVEESP